MEGWDDVIMHLVKAQQIAKELPRSQWWNSYIDEIDCDSALGELIESAKSELQPKPADVTKHLEGIVALGMMTTFLAPPDYHVHPFTD